MTPTMLGGNVAFQIGTPAIHQDDHGLTVEAELNYDEVSPVVWFRVPEKYAPDEQTIGDAFLASMLPVAMARGEDMVIDAPVSAKLLEGIETIQSTLFSWYPDVLKRVSITAAAEVSVAPTGSKTFSCFSGGVDSFSTLIKNRDSIDTLAFVEGFDIPLANIVLSRRVKETVHAVAADFGKDVAILSTNLKTFTDKEVNWAFVAHGAALASVGHILQRHFGTMLVPSTHSLEQMFPWGSHVLLDHHWSTDRLSVVHDGAEDSRVEKTLALADDPSAQKHLRVCWQNRGPYNCGTCEKCLRTMTALEFMGVLDKFAVFPEVPLAQAVGALKIVNLNAMEFRVENLQYAEAQGIKSPLVDALAASIEDYRERKKRAGPATPPNVASGFAKAATLRAELAASRKRERTLQKQLAASQARVAKLEKSLPLRAWRGASRRVRRLKADNRSAPAAK